MHAGWFCRPIYNGVPKRKKKKEKAKELKRVGIFFLDVFWLYILIFISQSLFIEFRLWGDKSIGLSQKSVWEYVLWTGNMFF